MTASGHTRRSGLFALRLVALPFLGPALRVSAVFPRFGAAAVTLWGQTRTIGGFREVPRLAAVGLLRRVGHQRLPGIGAAGRQARGSSVSAVIRACSGSEVRADGFLDIHCEDAEAKRVDDLGEEHGGVFLVAGVNGRHRGCLCFHYLPAWEEFRHQRAARRDQRLPIGVIG